MAPRRGARRPLWWGVVALILVYVTLQTPIGQRLDLGLAPLLETIQRPVQWWREASLWLQDRRALQRRLIETQFRLERKAALIQEANSLREENAQLRRLLKIEQLSGYRWEAAKVLGRSPDRMSQHLVIRTPRAKPDDAVLSSEGLVGLIDEASRDHAIVRTILDASLAVPVTVRDRPLAAVVRGQGDGLLVDFVPLEEAPETGTLLQTSGAGGLFPPGIPVARVTGVARVEGEIFARITAEPAAHWQRDNWLALAHRTRER